MDILSKKIKALELASRIPVPDANKMIHYAEKILKYMEGDGGTLIKKTYSGGSQAEDTTSTRVVQAAGGSAKNEE